MFYFLLRVLFFYLLFRFLFKLIFSQTYRRKENVINKSHHKRSKNDKSDYKDAVDVEFEEIE